MEDIRIITVEGGPYDSNIYLIRSELANILIDAGTGLANRVVAGRVRSLIGDGRLDAILLTHEHFDHCGGALALSRELGGTVMCSEPCANVVNGPNTLFTGAFLFGSTMDPIIDARPVQGEIRIGDVELEVVPSPGHCPGLVCYLHRRSGSLFCGDLIFCDGGVGRWDLPGGDLADHIRSIRNLKRLDVRGLYPGHGRTETENARGQISLSITAMAGM